jgi:arylsulfatase A-like enzyme
LSRRHFLGLVGGAAALGAMPGALRKAMASAAPGGSKPNIVFIFSDDQGYADISCFGSTTIKTPCIDKMAAEGMKLTDFYAAPVCTPSRTSLMTGCYPQRAGMGAPGGKNVCYPGQPEGLNPSEITIAKLLKGQGYATACIGKWHLGDQPPFLPTSHGFDYYFGIPFSNNMGNMYGLPPLPLMQGEKVIEENPKQALLTQRYTEEAIKFIEANKGKPFFVYLPHTMPHNPVAASEKFRGRTTRGAYGDACEEIDWSTGQILDALKQHGLDEKTLVMYVSDNGGPGGAENTPLRGGKGSTWEGGIRVCAVARWPGKISAGTVCKEIASTMDILPTFARLAGTEAPKDRIIDGIDIWPLLSGQAGAKGRETFFYYDGDSLQAVRSGKWKLMVVERERKTITRLDPPRLYDLEKDISETTDVAAQNPEVVKRLQGLIEACRADLGDHGVPGKNCRPVGYYKDAKTLTTKKSKA